MKHPNYAFEADDCNALAALQSGFESLGLRLLTLADNSFLASGPAICRHLPDAFAASRMLRALGGRQ